MLKTNFEAEFKKLSFQLERLKNQLYYTFDLKKKEQLKSDIKNIYSNIDNILDEYNRERS